MGSTKDKAFQIFRFDTLESTNSYAREHISELANLSVVVADCQTAGRGQRGNRWLSAPGENLTFSLVLRPDALAARDQIRLTALASVALRETVLAEGMAVRIKWPNDLYAGERKLAGMLIENTLSDGRVAASVIGIGLNVNQTDFPGELINPTSLRRLSGRSFSCAALLGGFLQQVAAWLPRLGSDELWEAYTAELFGRGERRLWTDCESGETFYGTIVGVCPDGRLEIRRDDATLARYSFKEIGYVL